MPRFLLFRQRTANARDDYCRCGAGNFACTAATDGRDSVVRPEILAERTLRSENPSFSSGGTADYFAVALM
jgi:hypothetical protein